MLTEKKFKALANVKKSNCVSIYIPTRRSGKVKKDQIRFKNALSKVEDKLLAKGMTPQKVESYLQKANDLLNDREFWRSQSDGLAVFFNKKRFEYYQVPIDLNPAVYVSDEFILSPVLSILNGEYQFYVLAISQHLTRFFEADQYGITPIVISDLVPMNVETMYEAMGTTREESLQFRGGQTATGQGMFHGQGAKKDYREIQIEEYLREVDKGLMTMLCNDKLPLVVIGDDSIAPIFINMTEYKYVLEDYVSGNPDEDDPALLHEKAWEVIEENHMTKQDKYKEEFGNYLAEEKASFNAFDIVPAALNGQVEVLFVQKDAYLWGEYDEATNTIITHSKQKKNSVDLLNQAAVQTYLNGGTVYSLDRMEMPRLTSNVNAILRYSV